MSTSFSWGVLDIFEDNDNLSLYIIHTHIYIYIAKEQDHLIMLRETLAYIRACDGNDGSITPI